LSWEREGVMPIEVTCRGCGKVLRVKESLAGKSGKCPQCGKVIHVPEPEPHVQLGQAQLTAHVVGVKVRGGVKKEDIPLRGTQMIGFARPVVVKVRVAPQAVVGLMLTIVGVLLALAPTVPAVPIAANVAPILGLAGGLIGALGAALAGWGLLNILQMPGRYRGKGTAFVGVGVGIVAFVLGLMAFTGRGGGAAAGGSIATKVGAVTTIAGKVEVQKCADQLEKAYKLLKSFAEQKSGGFPTNLTDLSPQFVPNLELLVCPIAREGTVLYEYKKGLTPKSAPDTPLLYDAKGNHEGGRNVLLVSGKVVWMAEEAFQEALKAAGGPATPEPAKAAEEPAPVSRRAPAAGGESAAPSPAAGQPETAVTPAPEAPAKPSAPAQETGPAPTPAPSPEAAQPEKPAAPSEGAAQPEKPAAPPSE
jgi:phage FluMu protein Com